MFWRAYSRIEVRDRVLEALSTNIRYQSKDLMGYPGSYLNPKVFFEAPFLDDAPFLRAYMDNPNHIGCHTMGESEPTFQGTQEIEREVLRLCSEEILQAPTSSIDGYVSSGGTESNIQALWAHRNYFKRAKDLQNDVVGVVFSEDTHYSIPKACNLLGLHPISIPVMKGDRTVNPQALRHELADAACRGIRALVIVLNMGTTMFGSVDDLSVYLDALRQHNFPFRVHVDAAFGGFVFPFTSPNNTLSFADSRIHSVTLDAHKMLQAPYGTGIFLIRKGCLHDVATQEAHYVPGGDITLCGSRAGANAVAVWMIMASYGSEGLCAYAKELVGRTDRLCAGLDKLGCHYFRNPYLNVVAIGDADVTPELAQEYHLVPDFHGKARWWKAVVMDHVDDGLIDRFIAGLGGRSSPSPQNASIP